MKMLFSQERAIIALGLHSGGDSVGGSKLTEQTLNTVVFNLHQIKRRVFLGTPGMYNSGNI